MNYSSKNKDILNKLKKINEFLERLNVLGNYVFSKFLEGMKNIKEKTKKEEQIILDIWNSNKSKEEKIQKLQNLAISVEDKEIYILVKPSGKNYRLLLPNLGVPIISNAFNFTKYFDYTGEGTHITEVKSPAILDDLDNLLKKGVIS